MNPGGTSLKRLFTIVFFVFTVLSLVLGQIHYSNKVESHTAKASAQYQVEIKEQQRIEKEKEASRIAEEKAIYEKHKGENLIYSPIGDSLALGQGATAEAKKYTALLSKMIESKMGYDVHLAKGITAGGKGLKDAGIPNLQKVINEEPDLVTIEFGTNDLNPDKEETYLPPQEFQEKLQHVIDKLNSELPKPPKIILVTTWNSGGSSITYDEIIERVGEVNNIPIANIQQSWQNRNDTFGPANYNDFMNIPSDNWHPNDHGYQLVAEMIFKEAFEVLK